MVKLVVEGFILLSESQSDAKKGVKNICFGQVEFNKIVCIDVASFYLKQKVGGL